VPWLLAWEDPGLAFDIALHLGTLVALLWFFAADWARLIRAGIASIVERKIGGDLDRRLAWLLAIGSVPGAIVGVLAENAIENLFHAPDASHRTDAMIAMAVIIALLGAALFIVERIARHVRALEQVSLKDALIIGCAQAMAIFPGVSRSGATITAGLAVGFKREAAARFSFLLSTPIIAGAGAKSMLGVFNQFRAGALPSSELALFAVGLLTAALSGYFCIKFLLRYLQNNSTDLFVYYRWALAVFLIVVAWMRG